MDVQRLFFLLGGIEVCLGSVVTIWPDQAVQVIGYAMLTFGVFTVAYGIWGWERRLLVSWFGRRQLLGVSWWPPFRRLISIREAARLAYVKTQESLAAAFAEHDWGGQQADPLGWYITALLGQEYDGVRIYGRKPESTKWQIIPPETLRTLRFSHELNSYIEPHTDTVRFVDPYISAKDLRNRTKEIGSWEIYRS